MRRYDLLPSSPVEEDGQQAGDEEEGDDSSMFQLEMLDEGGWRDLQEQLGRWFQEGRAVDLALGMLRQKIRLRRSVSYSNWAEDYLEALESGIALGTVPSRERTPPDFFSWAMQMDDLLHSAFQRARERQGPGDEVSMMDRYRNGRRRIRDSRSPRRGSHRRETECTTTEVRRLVPRSAASSGSGGAVSREEERPDRPVRTSIRQRTAIEPKRRPASIRRAESGEERASGSTDTPAWTPPPGISPDLPDLQSPLSQAQAVNLWRYLLFDRWTFSIPRERVPTGWLPNGTIQDVNRHLAALSEHNLQAMTVGLLTMLRYLMAELSQCMDFAQVVHNTENERLEDGAADEGDESLLMQNFFATSGRSTMEQRWTRAILRLHKELEGQPESMRMSSISRLRACLPGCMMEVSAVAWLSQLQALLTAIASDVQGVQGTVAPPSEWMEGWVAELAAFIPGLCLRHLPELVESQQQTTDEVIAGLLQDEAEEREWDQAEQQQLEDREKERLAHEALCEQEVQYLASEAMTYQRWEQHVTAEALQQHEMEGLPPAKRRCLVSLEVASGSNDRPRILQTQGFDVPSNGTELRITLRANMETVPSEVPTIPAVGVLGMEQHAEGEQALTLAEASTHMTAPSHLEACSEVTAPSMLRDSSEVERTAMDAATPELPDTVPLGGVTPIEGAQTENPSLPGATGSLEAVRPTPADLLGLLEFNEYSMVYDQWKRGALTQQEILEQYGQEVVDLMIAQELVSAELDGEESDGQAEDEAPTQVLFQQRQIMVQAGDGTWVRPKPHVLEEVYE